MVLVYNSAALMTNNCVQYVRNFCQTNLISVIWNSLQLLNGFENLCNPTVWSKGVDTDPHGSVFKMQILIQKSKIICSYPNKFKKIGCKCYFIFKNFIYVDQLQIFFSWAKDLSFSTPENSTKCLNYTQLMVPWKLFSKYSTYCIVPEMNWCLKLNICTYSICNHNDAV